MIRTFDVLFSVIILIIFSPIIFIILILIWIFDGRPIIFKQPRVGYKGKEFVIFKFRTMKNVFFKHEEFRVTVLGKILRKTSLDELPQLINVLRNEMSLVGPRPLPKNIENKINKFFKKKRRQILPGITGMSQINFTGQDRKLKQKIQLDLKYIDNYNIKNYFKILLQTPFTLILRFYKNKSSIIK